MMMMMTTTINALYIEVDDFHEHAMRIETWSFPLNYGTTLNIRRLMVYAANDEISCAVSYAMETDPFPVKKNGIALKVQKCLFTVKMV